MVEPFVTGWLFTVKVDKVVSFDDIGAVNAIVYSFWASFSAVTKIKTLISI